MTHRDAFDVEFYRDTPRGWYWAIFAAGTGRLYGFGESRFKFIATLRLRRDLRRLLATYRLEGTDQ